MWRAGRVSRLAVIPSPGCSGMERCAGNTRGQSKPRPRRIFGARQLPDRARVASEMLMPPPAGGSGPGCAVAQPVVDGGEQLAGRGDLGDVLAAAALDPFAVDR